MFFRQISNFHFLFGLDKTEDIVTDLPIRLFCRYVVICIDVGMSLKVRRPAKFLSSSRGKSNVPAADSLTSTRPRLKARLHQEAVLLSQAAYARSGADLTRILALQCCLLNEHSGVF